MSVRTSRKAISLALALSFVFMIPTSPAARPSRVSVFRKKIAPGVVHMVIRKRKGPLVIHVIKVDPAGRASIRPALAQGRLPGLETTSSMARRHRAIAAVNGDFFWPTGRPVGTFARGGELVQTPVMPSASFAIARNDRATYVGHRRVRVEMIDPQTGRSNGVARVNSGRPGFPQLALFTPRGGSLERPPPRACSARLRRIGGFRMSPAIGTVGEFRVSKVACRKKRMARLGGIVISARRGGSRRRDVSELRRGQRINLAWRWPWPEVVDTLGGNPVLIRNGRIEWQNMSGNHYIFKRHPRTGVGVTASGKVLLVTVDGRRRRHSVGMRLGAFAKLLKSLGAKWALNLDGGGSTTMTIGRRVVNGPSDRYERPVGSALLVTTGAARLSRPYSMPVADATSSVPAEPNGAVYDPASFGGLASWMGDRGSISPRLARAAGDFESYFGRSPGTITRTPSPELLP